MDSPIKDLVDMIKQFKDADIESLLRTAYNRGYQDGIEITKTEIVERLKDFTSPTKG